MKKFKEMVSNLKRNEKDNCDGVSPENQNNNEPQRLIEDYLLDAPLKDIPKETIFDDTNNTKYKVLNNSLMVEQKMDLSTMHYNDNQFLAAVEFLAFLDGLDEELGKISKSYRIAFSPNNKLYFMCALECSSINEASSMINDMFGEVIKRKAEYIKRYDKKYSMAQLLGKEGETEIWAKVIVLNPTNTTKLKSGEEVTYFTDENGNDGAVIASSDGKTMYLSQQ